MLRIKDLTFSYSAKPVLQNLSFNVKQGENVAIIGESGSGKTTLLKLLYGMFDLDEGSISWKNEPVLGPKYNLVYGEDYIKYVAQEFDLMPFISVEENIGKHLSNFFPEEKKERIKEILEIIGMQEFAKIKIKNLSGGQKQRVALGRAISNKPEILLLDEPFSHIDNFKKRSLRRNLFNFLKKENISCLVATHDKDDIISHSDKIIVLENGIIVDVGAPKEIRQNPKSKLIASFFGEFSVFKASEIFERPANNNEIYVYATQLEVVNKSNLEVEVSKNYYQGENYLIASTFKSRTVYFQHPVQLNLRQKVFLGLSKKLF